MKLKIKTNTDDEVVYVWLEERDGNIIVKATKLNSDYDWRLLEITPKGVMVYNGLSESLGFPLDDRGSLKKT